MIMPHKNIEKEKWRSKNMSQDLNKKRNTRKTADMRYEDKLAVSTQTKNTGRQIIRHR